MYKSGVKVDDFIESLVNEADIEIEIPGGWTLLSQMSAIAHLCGIARPSLALQL